MPEAQLLLSLIQQFIAIQSFISKFDALIRRAAVRNIYPTLFIHYCIAPLDIQESIILKNLASLAIVLFQFVIFQIRQKL